MYHQELVLILSFLVAQSTNFSYSNKRKEITSVTGSIGQLPCYVEGNDDVAMILWFKEVSGGSPIYSYDGRNENEPPRHLPGKSELGLRLHFRVPSRTSTSPSSRPPALLIRNLKQTDSGSYRCRIDYRNSPTTNYVIRLNVIQPPTRLEIQDLSSQSHLSSSDQEIPSSDRQSTSVQNDITYMGPYIEGQNVTVLCTAFGGTPLPEVIWYRNGTLTDWSYDIKGRNESVTNALVITSLERSHSHDLYTCTASNNNETKPISHRVNVDVYSTVKHIEVEVPDQMTAGAQYNLACRTKGSYPAVKLEFWKLQKRIGPRFQTKSDELNVVVYTIPFIPDADDNEAFVTCKAVNPWISQNFMEAGRKLNVVYPPVVVLRFGSTKRGNFSEGESVLLECHSKANPVLLNSITWFHQGKKLYDSSDAGIHLNGMTLVLRYLTPASGGTYACEVLNDVGKGRSNTLHLQLNISPKCTSSKEKVIPLAVGESRELECSILAWPPDLNFYWTLNRSGGILPLSSVGQIIKLNLSEDGGRGGPSRNPKNFGKDSMEIRRRGKEENHVEGDGIFHQSQLSYQVNSETDFGLIGCWAKNSYGKQVTPCLFRIVPHDTEPQVPNNDERVDGFNNTTVDGNGEEDDSSFRSHKGDGTPLSQIFLSTYSIILVGILIFITLFTLFGYTFVFHHVRRRRRTPPSQPSP